jgi:DNA-binding response OmpR family regulator
MLVEPDIGVQKMIAGALGPEEDDWAMVCVATAEDALSLSEVEPFDLVVATERLSDRSGSELLACIKKYRRGPSVFFWWMSRIKRRYAPWLVKPSRFC